VEADISTLQKRGLFSFALTELGWAGLGAWAIMSFAKK